MKREKDYFSKGIVIYAACFFLTYKTLFQLSYVQEFSGLWYLAAVMIAINVFGLIWCMGACLFRVMRQQFDSFATATSLVVILEILSPDPMRVHFWLHRGEYVSRIAAAKPAADGRLSIVLYVHADRVPCETEILYDNSGNPDLISESDEGRASFRRIDDDFYLRYPPCG